MGPSHPNRQAQDLRDLAEQYLRLASGTDQATHDALVMYASELLDRAQGIEERAEADEAPTPDQPDPRRSRELSHGPDISTVRPIAATTSS